MRVAHLLLVAGLAAGDERAAMRALCELIPSSERERRTIDCATDACDWPPQLPDR